MVREERVHSDWINTVLSSNIKLSSIISFGFHLQFFYHFSIYIFLCFHPFSSSTFLCCSSPPSPLLSSLRLLCPSPLLTLLSLSLSLFSSSSFTLLNIFSNIFFTLDLLSFHSNVFSFLFNFLLFLIFLSLISCPSNLPYLKLSPLPSISTHLFYPPPNLSPSILIS